MNTQKIMDKLQLIQNEDNAYAIEPIIAEDYGLGRWMDAIVLKSDVYSTGMEKLLKEFDHVFFSANQGLVIGIN